MLKSLAICNSGTTAFGSWKPYLIYRLSKKQGLAWDSDDWLQSDFAESEESASWCKKREAELLEFTQRLTETNANLQVGSLQILFVSMYADLYE